LDIVSLRGDFAGILFPRSRPRTEIPAAGLSLEDSRKVHSCMPR
jgi:hypothetical protein